MDKFKELVSLCNASVSIIVNNHKDLRQTVEDNIHKTERKYIEPQVFDEMVSRDLIVEVQFYPDTPRGYYNIYHYDIDKAVELALEVIKNRR